MHTLRPLAARITAAAQLRPVFIFAVVLPALLPLLRTSAIPNTPDGLNHFYRIVELDWHIRHGVLYPRVMADLFHGFSYPLFNFYPPLAYYLALPVRWLGGSFPTAFLALNAAALYFGALGAFYLADDMFGELAGCLASAAVTYAPYTLFNVIQRGAIPEAWALALFPWLLWIFRRLALSSRPTARDFGLGTTLYAALLLSHNLMALVITPILVAWTLLWHLLAIRHSQFTLRNSQFSLRNSQFVIRHWASAIRHWSLAIRHAVPGAQAEWDSSFSPWSSASASPAFFGCRLLRKGVGCSSIRLSNRPDWISTITSSPSVNCFRCPNHSTRGWSSTICKRASGFRRRSSPSPRWCSRRVREFITVRPWHFWAWGRSPAA